MKHIIVGDAVVSWVEQRINDGQSLRPATALGLTENGLLRAGVVFNNHNGSSMCIHVASDGTKRWMNKRLLWSTFDYAFNHVGVNVLLGLVSSANEKALAFDRNLGFVERTRIPDAHPEGDLVILTMTRGQCRFIGKRDERKAA